MEIPQNSLNLKAFYRYSVNSSWVQIDEKNSEDFFNGINAVRFEYDSNLVYVSTTFSNNTDSLFIKLTNDINNNVFLIFDGVCKYYDNSSAVVCATADDLDKYKINTTFHTAFHEFRKRNLWLSCGASTGRCDNDTWQKIQLQLDSGLVEIDSHSRTHVEAPYPDTEAEVGGSKDDIINNLDLP